MNRKQLNEILNQLKVELDVTEPIKLELRPMKIKAASVSLDRGIIRLNKNLIPDLDEECVRYLLIHELLHYKLKNTYHNGEFRKRLTDKLGKNKVTQLERKIIANLIRLNNTL